MGRGVGHVVAAAVTGAGEYTQAEVQLWEQLLGQPQQLLGQDQS